MAVLWLVAGLWKLSDISGWQLKLTQLLVPASLSLVGTLVVSMSEVGAGILLLRPAWRRWGGLLSTVLLLGFMAYVGFNYETLRGEDCSCFPWLERAVGPAFFWSDGAMLAVSLLAVRFSDPPSDQRRIGIPVLAVVLLAGVMFGVDRIGSQPSGEFSASITVEGAPYEVGEGKVFLFFFNPSCMHCLHAAETLSGYEWTADVIGLPTQDPDWGPGFLEDAKFPGVRLSPDTDRLRETFEFQDVPFGVLLDDGSIVGELVFWDEPALSATFRDKGFIR